MKHIFCLTFILAVAQTTASGADWSRFRGPNGSGISPDSASIPTTWGDEENLLWKTDLPGPGLSSPIVVGDRIVLTCWTGYAVDRENPGSLDDLKRNVICVDRTTGDIIWSKTVDPVLPEDTFRGMFAENGYASHTPATDGERIYVFFGKTGVFAFNLADGQQIWHHKVGGNLEGKGWGSASSPIVHNELVIVPAFIEGDALVAFNGKSGEVVWKLDAPGYRSNWSTPIVVEANGHTDVVLAVPGEVWGINPETGKLRWYCEVPGSDSARASVVAHGDLVIAMAGGRGANTSIAVKAGEKGAREPIWVGRDVSGIATPVIYDGKMYVVSNRVTTCVDIETGQRISQTRLSGGSSTNRGGSRSGGRGGRGGGQDYSSPIVAGGHLYYTSRSGDMYVVALGEDPKQVARNSFASDSSDFSSTPAVSDGQLFVRSSKALYCIAAK